MKKNSTIVAALTLIPALLCAAGTVRAQEGAPVSLKLRDAVKMAVENNLDAKVELYNPAMAQADIGSALGIYDPLLNLSLDYSRSNSFNTFTFAPLRQDVLQANAGVSQLLSTGGSAGANVGSSWVSNSFDYYNTVVNFTASQPLLKNFGKETTELTINVARFSKQGAMDRFRTRLSDIVAKVRSDYFTLYSLRQDLEVKRTSYDVAVRFLTDTRGRVSAGVLPAMEILNAEFGVAQREKEIIDAEKALADQVDVLRLELQLPGVQDILPVDLPTQEPFAVSEKDAVVRALAERPELVEQRVNVSINDLQKRVARNQTLPDLNLNANLGLGSFDPSFGSGLRRTATGDAPVWGVGLAFTYPLGNNAAENAYIRSKLQLEQSQTQLHNLEATISNDVRTAIRALASSFKQIDVTNRNTAYAQDRLTAFQKKNAVGLATAKEVIDVLNDLVTARGNQIKAVVAYNNALTQLWRATGEILDRVGVQVTQREADALYEKNRASK